MPMLFHSIVGKDEREGNSPSWFNVQECKQVRNALHTAEPRQTIRIKNRSHGCCPLREPSGDLQELL
jgi:helicase MOV-10